ncbi:MAG: hypothetical protein KC457_20710 [Myxococcales bacterium]|nr:hypothetical protein [Myxococcales bacterium]
MPRSRPKLSIMLELRGCADLLEHHDLEPVEALRGDAILLRRRVSGKAVVLRLLPWDFEWTEAFLETRWPALARLRIPGTVRLIDVGDEPSYLLRGYVPGIDAGVDGTPLPVDLAIYPVGR